MVLNCWEYKRCGLEEGGVNSSKGVCPASTEKRLEGVNHGKNGGRSCFAIPKTLCCGNNTSTYLIKISECLKCDFYHMIQKEEGDTLISGAHITQMIR